MSYSYSYKSSSNSGSGMPSRTGNDAEFQAAKMQAMMGAPMGGSGGGSGSYSYQSSSSTGGTGMPAKMGNDAEFHAAKMQAMMGAPIGGSTGGSSSYSYKSSSSNSGMPNRGVSGGSHVMDAEMERTKREMESNMPSNVGSSANSYSYRSESSNSGSNSTGTPQVIPFHEDGKSSTSGGTTVKKVVTTTTTKSNPQAVRELESIERDFKRMGKTPDNYQDDFDKIKHEVLSGEAYKGAPSTQQPVSTKIREEYKKTSKNVDTAASPRLIPLSVEGGKGGGVESTTTTTTRTYKSGSGGPTVTEEKVISTSGGRHGQPNSSTSETYIPIKTYDNTFDDFHMNRWMDQKGHFGSFGANDLDLQRMEWENRLSGIKSGFFSFPNQKDMMTNTNTTIDSSRTVSKNPLGKPEFSVQFEMRDFNPGDIAISTRNGKLIIKATHEEKVRGSTSKREFSRTVDLPSDVQVNLMRSVYSRDGILSITAPIKPPQYNPKPSVTSYRSASSDYETQTPHRNTTTWSSPQQNTNTWSSPPVRSHGPSTASQQATVTRTTSTTSSPRSLSRASSSSASSTKPEPQKVSFTFHEPVVGYDPEDINVTVTGRKVKVHAKHVETTPGGRRIHNEFTKMFDLPANYGTVECYIKDGRSLFIVPYLRDDIEGSFVFIPIEHK